MEKLLVLEFDWVEIIWLLSSLEINVLKLLFYTIVGEEKNKKDVDHHSVKAAEYLYSLDGSVAPNKPITWMLIRPPWSSSKSICLKHLVHTQMLTINVCFC